MFTLFMFNMCEIRKCADITIMNDATLENVEFFFVRLLTSNLDLAISLDPNVGKVEITDNDGLWNMPCVLHSQIFFHLHNYVFYTSGGGGSGENLLPGLGG